MEQPENAITVTAHVVVCSDRAAAQQYEDLAGPAAQEWLVAHGVQVSGITVIPDSEAQLEATVRHVLDGHDILIISGGTGLSTRDITPQVLDKICDYCIPGIGEQLRRESLKYSPNALLSRGGAWMKHGRIVYALPGNPKAVLEQLNILGPLVKASAIAAKGLCTHRGHRGSQ